MIELKLTPEQARVLSAAIHTATVRAVDAPLMAQVLDAFNRAATEFNKKQDADED